MNAMLDHITERLADPILFLARLLLAWLFAHEGFWLVANFNDALAGLATLGVSEPLVIATIALQLVAGAAIITGWQTRLAALALGLFCVATATLFHTNFEIRDEVLHFDKDLAIAGGLLALAICGAGAWSLDRLLFSRGIKPSFEKSHKLG